MRSRLLGIVRPGVLGRYGLWHMARWGAGYVVRNKHDRQYGLWVMSAVCLIALLVLWWMAVVHTRRKGALDQVCVRGTWRCGPGCCRHAPRVHCAVLLLCLFRGRAGLREEGRYGRRWVGWAFSNDRVDMRAPQICEWYASLGLHGYELLSTRLACSVSCGLFGLKEVGTKSLFLLFKTITCAILLFPARNLSLC